MTALLVYILAAVLLGAVAAEVIARIWVRLDNRYFVFAPYTKLLMFPDEETHPQLERQVYFEVNADGERGPPRVNQPNAFQVLVAGGSAAECYFLDQRTAWPSQLGVRLSDSRLRRTVGDSQVHVGSIARSGIHSAGLRLTLERVLPRYDELDILILMVGAGDVLQWMINGTPAEGLPPSTIESCFARHPEATFGLAPRTTALAELARRVRARAFPQITRRERAGRWIGRVRSMRAAARDIRTSTPDAETFFSAYEANLGEAIDLAKAHARHVLVVRQPWFEKDNVTDEEQKLFWNGGVGDIMHDEVTTFYSDDVMFALLHRVDALTSRAARERDVAQMELMSVVPASIVHYYDHFHHTPAGAAIIADAVATKILEMVSSPSREEPVASISTRESSR